MPRQTGHSFPVSPLPTENAESKAGHFYGHISNDRFDPTRMSGITVGLSKYLSASPGQLNFINDIGHVAIALQNGSVVGGSIPGSVPVRDDSGKKLSQERSFMKTGS